MGQSADPHRVLCFGSFEVDIVSGELRRQGLKIRLQDQPFRLLVLLLGHAGDVVTRENVRETLWPADLVAHWVIPRSGPTQSSRRLTLAVLPFDNLSGHADQEYLSDGLTEEMITQLGRLEPDRLRVLARSSTWKYKGADRDIRQLRQEQIEEHTSELQSPCNLVCRLLLEKKKKKHILKLDRRE